MKQSDILSFAINGVQRELADTEERLEYLTSVLNELHEADKKTELVLNCTRCRQDPCICVGM